MTQTSLKARMLEAFRGRMYFFIIGVSSVFLIFALQLINLQLIQGESYQLKSKMNMENNIPIPAARGEMYDRNFQKNVSGTVIVSNRPSFNLTTVPQSFKSDAELIDVLDRLAIISGIDAQKVYADIRRSNSWARFLIKDDVNFDVIVNVASHKDLF